jgi:very-short-patch-repair endonuclease
MARISSTDDLIGRLATEHGGYVSRRSLMASGLSRNAIEHRLDRGLLIWAYHGVYAVGHQPTDPISRAKGALLAAGPRSALADISAGAYYGILKHWRHPLHLTVPTDRRIQGLVIHRNRRLRQSDILTPEPGLRVISPALALLDTAPYLTERRLRRVVNELRLRHRIPLTELEATLGRFARHPGVPLLRPVVATSQRQPNRSGWEDDWPSFAAAHQLPPYVMNEIIEGHRVDILFTAEQLIVELDGWETHQTREAFIKDREQDAHILAATGIPTIRLTHERFHRHPAREAGRLQAIFARRRSELDRAAG